MLCMNYRKGHQSRRKGSKGHEKGHIMMKNCKICDFPECVHKPYHWIMCIKSEGVFQRNPA